SAKRMLPAYAGQPRARGAGPAVQNDQPSRVFGTAETDATRPPRRRTASATGPTARSRQTTPSHASHESMIGQSARTLAAVSPGRGIAAVVQRHVPWTRKSVRYARSVASTVPPRSGPRASVTRTAPARSRKVLWPLVSVVAYTVASG